LFQVEVIAVAAS